MRHVQSIYEYFNTYTENEINKMLESLSQEEQALLTQRYGNDLCNPCTQDDWDLEKSKKFYGTLVPKMKRILIKQKNEKKINFIDFSLEEAINIPLVQLIKQKLSLTEICEKLNITPKELYNQLLFLENMGFSFNKKYYSDGSIHYQKIQKVKDWLIKNNISEFGKTLITNNTEDQLKVMVISDLHFGNELERLDLIDRVYNYCIKRDIRIILVCGDLVDGKFSKNNQKITNLYKQIEYFINNYPYDKHILTFGIVGDHDQSILNAQNLDIISICNNYRHDIVLLGYNIGRLNIKNDSIDFCHNLFKSQKTISSSIVLQGHLHSFKVKNYPNHLFLQVPSLSDLEKSMPTALELNLFFDKGVISKTLIKQVYFDKKDLILNEINFTLSNIKDNHKPIANIENFTRIRRKK